MSHHPTRRRSTSLSPNIATLAVLAAVVLATPAQASPTLVAQTSPQTPASNAWRPVDRIVAIVNSEAITDSELQARLQSVVRQLRQQGVSLPSQNQLMQQVLERMVLERAQLQLAKENGIQIDPGLVEKTVQRVAAQNNLSVPAFIERLESEGLSLQTLREDIRTEMLLTRVREREVDARLQISDAEVDAWLAEQNNNQGLDTTALNLAQILIPIPEKATPKDIDAAKEKAQRVMNELKQGGDFARLAASYSAAPEALKGGELGLRAANRLPQLFTDAMVDANVNEVKLVKSANGFHLLKLLDRQANLSPAVPPVRQTRARHILLRPNEVLNIQEARRRLQVIRERIRNGTARFEDMAKQYGGDGTASKGGDLGWLFDGDTVPEFERAMNDLAVGQLSDIIESPFGLHIIEVTERKKEPPPLDRLRQNARQTLREMKADEAYQDWLRQLRDRTYVEQRLDANS